MHRKGHKLCLQVGRLQLLLPHGRVAFQHKGNFPGGHIKKAAGFLNPQPGGLFLQFPQLPPNIQASCFRADEGKKPASSMAEARVAERDCSVPPSFR